MTILLSLIADEGMWSNAFGVADAIDLFWTIEIGCLKRNRNGIAKCVGENPIDNRLCFVCTEIAVAKEIRD